jgi:hypothetical protein
VGTVGENLPYPIPNRPDFMEQAVNDFIKDYIDSTCFEYKKIIEKEQNEQ